MRLFFDRSAPLPIACMVRAIDGKKHTILHHDEDSRFSQTTKDAAWIEALAQDGLPLWIVISGDGRILKNKVEKKCLAEAGLTFFCLDSPWPNMPIYEYAWKFMRVWPGIVRSAEEAKAKIYKIGAGKTLKIEPVG